MKVPDFTKLKGPQFTEKHFSIHYPELHQYLIQNYPADLKFQEKIYWYRNNITEHPKCKCCDKSVKLINSNAGYQIYCSKKCLNSDPDKQEKAQQTNLELYGTRHAAQSKAIKKKTEQIFLDKYGATNPMKNRAIQQKSQQTNIERYGGCGNASEELKAKQRATMMERYGDEFFNNMEKAKQTCLERYGTERAQSDLNVRRRISDAKRKQTLLKNKFIISITESGDWICKCPHPGCNKCEEKTYIINPNRYRDRLRDHTEPCTNLLPIDTTHKLKDTWPEIFIKQILEEHNIKYVENDRTIISPKEIDIYCPDLHLGFECNGLYWHSSKFKPNNYHIQKSQAAKDSNIRLYHIWEDWAVTKSNILKSMVLNWIGCSQNKIYARQCEIQEVSGSEGLKFLEENHIQGRSQYQVGYGLYYQNKLVSLMTFSKKRGGCMGATKNLQEGSWELVRFCSALNTNVIGGASKLLKYFLKHNEVLQVISFASADISTGNLYNKLGFTSDGKVTGSYWYIDPETFKRYHRSTFTRQGISKKWPQYNIDDKSWTETIAMDEQGYIRIYDSGTTKWVLNV